MNGDSEARKAAYARARTGSRHPGTASAPRGTTGTTTTLSDTDFAASVEDRYFEDYVPGAVYVHGSITMTRENILRFADEFDPQNIHNDPQAARQGPFPRVPSRIAVSSPPASRSSTSTNRRC